MLLIIPEKYPFAGPEVAFQVVCLGACACEGPLQCNLCNWSDARANVNTCILCYYEPSRSINPLFLYWVQQGYTIRFVMGMGNMTDNEIHANETNNIFLVSWTPAQVRDRDRYVCLSVSFG